MEKKTAPHLKRIFQHRHELVNQNPGAVCTGSQRHGGKEQEMELKLEQFMHAGPRLNYSPSLLFFIFLARRTLSANINLTIEKTTANPLLKLNTLPVSLLGSCIWRSATPKSVLCLLYQMCHQ